MARAGIQVFFARPRTTIVLAHPEPRKSLEMSTHRASSPMEPGPSWSLSRNFDIHWYLLPTTLATSGRPTDFLAPGFGQGELRRCDPLNTASWFKNSQGCSRGVQPISDQPDSRS